MAGFNLAVHPHPWTSHLHLLLCLPVLPKDPQSFGLGGRKSKAFWWKLLRVTNGNQATRRHTVRRKVSGVALVASSQSVSTNPNQIINAHFYS